MVFSRSEPVFVWSSDIDALFNEHVWFENRYDNAFFNVLYTCREDQNFKIITLNFDEISFRRTVEDGQLGAFFEHLTVPFGVERILKWAAVPSFAQFRQKAPNNENV